MRSLPLPFLLLLSALLAPWLSSVSSAPAVSAAGLYQASDHLTPLKFDDLRATIYSGPNRKHWLLQLYHRYCGHCINFAPVFKAFANSATGLSHTVGLAVIDTADYSAALSHYGLNGVPSLLFISSNTTWEGKYFSKLNSEADLMDQLLSQLQGFIPQLAPLKPGEPVSGPALLEEASPGRLSQRLIVENLPGLSLRWRPKPDLASGVVRVSRISPVAGGGSSSAVLLGDSANIEELRRLLGPLRPASASNEGAKAANPAASLKPLDASSSSLGELRPPTLQDLRSGIIRALVSDATSIGLDQPGVWTAVSDFVRLLNAHLSPRSYELSRLLRPLAAWLPVEPPSTEQWLRALSDAGFPAQPPDQWVACRGSKPYLRGYPCSLWQLFHTLTAVRFATDGASGPPVMPVMRRFIIACFSCRYCARNFEKGTADMEQRIGKLPAAGAELLYLWRGHNMANQHLKGAQSEDPAYPKSRFPPAALCSNCVEGAAMADSNTAAFLVRWYGPEAGWASHPAGDALKDISANPDTMGFSRLDVAIVVLCFASALAVLLAVWCRLSRSGRRLCRRSPFRRSPSPI